MSALDARPVAGARYQTSADPGVSGSARVAGARPRGAEAELLVGDVEGATVRARSASTTGSSSATWTTRPSSSEPHMIAKVSTSTWLDLAGVDAGLDDPGDQVAPLARRARRGPS